jgi:HEAT repeat protein
MSNWSLKQWSEQLHSVDEPTRHEAAHMLGENGDASVVADLLEKETKHSNFWAATERGIPLEPVYRPLLQTITKALKNLGTIQLHQAHADLKAWHAWKGKQKPAERPEWKQTPLGALIAGMANTRRGGFSAQASSRAAWVLGEIGAELETWSVLLEREINWAVLNTLPLKSWGSITPNLRDFVGEIGTTKQAAARKVAVDLRAQIGVELVEMLEALTERRAMGEPNDLATVQSYLISSIGHIKYTAGFAAINDALRPAWPDLHWEIVTALGLLKLESGLEPLVGVLATAEGALKARTARALGMLGMRQATRKLLPLLNDDDPSIRTQALRALGRLAVPQTRDRIFQLLLDDDETVRFTAGTALGMLGDGRTVPYLLKAIAEGDHIVQREAEAAMRTLGTSTLTPLVQILRDGKPPYRAVAAQRLGALGDARAVRYLIPSLVEDDCGLPAAAALLAIGSASVEELLRYLSDDPELENVTPELKELVARVLGKIGDPRTVKPMLSIVDDVEQSHRLREEAARVLGQLGNTTAVKPLIKALSETSAAAVHIRAEAARALGRIGDSSPIPKLIDAVGDPEDKIRTYAIEALGAIGDARAVAPLIRELSGFRQAGRAGIIQALGGLGSSDAVEPLMAVATDQPHTYLNGYALQALAQLGDSRIVPLILHERGWHQELVQVLKSLGSSAQPPLVEELRTGEKPEIRALAALSLGDLGEDSSMGSLITALQDPSAQVQKAAARALAQIHTQ